MPTFPAPGGDTASANAPLAFPADTNNLFLSPTEWTGGAVLARRFTLTNAHHTVLHVKLESEVAWLSTVPDEAALGPGETQLVGVRVDTPKARASVAQGAPPSGTIALRYQRLFSQARTADAPEVGAGTVSVRLPVALCPACNRSLEGAIADGTVHALPEFCPFCFERLRACPQCGAANSWLARVCVIDPSHIVRTEPDWGTLGGNAQHTGASATRANLSLARRWSFPSVPPARRENALSWSAPVAAYGLVAAASATPDGEAHLYAFDARTGATLWDAYPLPDPVYPDRGGAALAGGHLLAATVEGVCVCVDALRGTRVWETALHGVVYGAVVPTSDSPESPLLINVTKGNRSHSEGGELAILHGKTGQVLHRVALPGPPDSAPAFAEGLAYTHDDGGHLTCVHVATGQVAWQKQCEAGFDSAPMLEGGKVFSATVAGVLWCYEAQTGELVWRTGVTNAPLGGTPACDGTLVYLPADDGLHLVAAQTGRSVRRYPLRAPVRAAPVVANGVLFFGAGDGNVWGAGGGKPLEKLYETGSAGSQILAAPAFADGAVFVTATNGVLYALSHEGGTAK